MNLVGRRQTIVKDFLKRIGLALSPRIDQMHYYFDFFNWKKIDQTGAVNKQTQILLALRYREIVHNGMSLPSLDEVEFRSFSQHGEDGILLYIFALIGTTNKLVVEICAGDGIECNAANLIVNHNWRGWLFDGSAAKIRTGRAFYSRHLNTLPHPPELVNAWIDTANVNSLVEAQGVSGEIDLLSLDMDGVDYWICQALSCLSPRVIVLEYNARLGPASHLTVPYRADFVAREGYFGASLAAFVELNRRKGYRLIGCDSSGVNAFFIRSGIADDILPEVSPEACFARSRAQQAFELHPLPEPGQKWIEP
jgi:hypothetical protein